MVGVYDRATGTAQAVAAKVDPYVPQVAKNVAGYAYNTTAGVANYALGTAAGVRDRTVNSANRTIDFGRFVVKGATTTVVSHTPNPIINLVTSTLDGARAVRDDPVGTVRGVSPTFVVTIGEKSYEIVVGTAERTQQGVAATSGFIVTKVNGVVQTVSSVPAIHSLINSINSITSPVLNKLGVTKVTPNGEKVIEHEGPVPVDASNKPLLD